MAHIDTSMGSIVVELDAEKAPNTVKNFVQYAKDKHYDGTIFHRVMANFMIQGGDFTKDMSPKPTRPPIKNEANNGLKNTRGTIAMARTNNPNSATAQFFINVKDNPTLNFAAPMGEGWGYAVFGKVVKGMDVVDSIRKVATTNVGGYANVPTKPVMIKTITIE